MQNESLVPSHQSPQSKSPAFRRSLFIGSIVPELRLHDRSLSVSSGEHSYRLPCIFSHFHRRHSPSMAKKQSLSSPCLLLSHAKRPELFVLTFENLGLIRDLSALRMFFLRADLPLPHRNALTYPRKHRKGARRRRHRSSSFRQQRTHTPPLSRKQRGSHPSSSLS